MNRLPKLIAILCVFALSECFLGCQGKTSGRYKPASATARQAVETALSKWKAGVKYGMMTDTKPIVIVEEPRWKSGIRLENYDIIEEVVGQEYPRFKVKLNFPGKPELIAEYVVVGIDPPIVYNKEEFEMTSGKAPGM